MTPRTFEIAARCVAAGADPEWIARTHYDSNRMARVRLFGAVLSGMTVDAVGPHRGAGDHAGDGRGRRRHLRRHRGPDQLPAVGAGSRRRWRSSRRPPTPGRLARQPALQGRRRRRRHRPGPRRRRPPQRRRLRVRGARSTRCAREFLDALERGGGRDAVSADAHRGRRRPRRRQAHRAHVPRRRRRWRGARFGARVGHTGTLDPLATGVLPLVRRACHPAGPVHERRRRRPTRRRSPSAARPTPTTPPGETTRGDRATPRRRGARGGAGRGAARPPAPDAAGLLGQEDRRRGRASPRPARHARRPGAGRRRGARSDAARRRRRRGPRCGCASQPGFYVRSLAHDLGTATRAPAPTSAALRRLRGGPVRPRRCGRPGRWSSPAEPGSARRRSSRSSACCRDLPRPRLDAETRRPGPPRAARCGAAVAPAAGGAGHGPPARSGRAPGRRRRPAGMAPGRLAAAARNRRACSRRSFSVSSPVRAILALDLKGHPAGDTADIRRRGASASRALGRAWRHSWH